MLKTMKALTVSQPFASLIADGEKFVENRIWETKYRGTLAIHAGKGSQYLTRAELRGYETGSVIATCELVACFSIRRILEAANDEAGSRLQAPGTPFTWADLARHKHTEGPYCWILVNIAKLPVPIPCVGGQRLWTFSARVSE